MAHFDMAVIGGGPAGYAAAEKAGTAGLKAVLFEKHELGGVCLNEGCIPTKTLLYSAKVYDTAAGAAKYGVTVEGVGADYARMVVRKNKVVRKLVAGIGIKMKSSGVTVVKGEAVIRGRDDQGFRVESGGEVHSADNLLICTGSEPFMLPVPGAAETGGAILTNKQILELKERPESLVVIGGGIIGMEFASLFNSLGTQVEVVEMLPEILGQNDAEMSAMLREMYAKRGVGFNLSCRVTRIEGNDVYFTRPDGSEDRVSGEKILVSVGRRAVTAGFGLETIGVEVVRGGIAVDERMRTNVPNVYAAGDVTGFSMFAHTAYREAEVIVNNLTGRDDAMRYDAVPGVVYTNPELASVGRTLGQALADGIDARELRLPMAYSGRFVAENEGGEGLCKIVVDENGRVLGVHLLGNPSSEMIWGASLAIERGMTAGEIEKLIFPHPTVSEIIREAAFLSDL